MQRMSRTVAALSGLALLLAAPVAGCDQQPVGTPPTGATIEEAAETLSLSLADGGDVVAVDLSYARRAEQAAPRMMELWVRYDGDLAFLGGEPLAALEVAGKELVVQDKGGVLRIIAYAADNTTVVDPGPVARLSFRRVGGGPASVTLEARSPFFAPAEANDGVLLGAPLPIPAKAVEGTP